MSTLSLPERDHQYRELRGCVRDLVALSTMSALWIGRPLGAIAESLRDVLAAMLHTDAAHVRLQEPGGRDAAQARAGHLPGPVESGHRISVPVGLNGNLGSLDVVWRRAARPSEVELVLLKVAANHAVIALQQAALLRRHEHAERLLAAQATRQAAVARLELRAVMGLRIDQMLDEAAHVVRETLQVDCCEVLELTGDGELLLLRAGAGWGAGFVGHCRISARPDSMTGFALSAPDPVTVTDWGQETRFPPSSYLHHRRIVASAQVVIRNPSRSFGVLGAHAGRPRVFTPSDVRFLQSIANLLAAAQERQRAEAEREDLLRQTQRAVAGRDLAVGIVSHDLGNPLSTIQICAAALLDAKPPRVAGVRHMARIIQRSAAWMQQIAHNLLDRASLDAGRLRLERRPTPVADLLSATREMFAMVAEERGLEFVVASAPELPLIDADPPRLLQVLSNLVGNAMKFTPVGGWVALSADGGAPAAPVRFAVSDSGPGIPPEELAHVCDWFWQAQRAGRGSNGLGLAIAKGLIESHGGALHVDSVPGQGSTFWFTVPVAHSENQDRA